jgi:protein SCO1/2
MDRVGVRSPVRLLAVVLMALALTALAGCGSSSSDSSRATTAGPDPAGTSAASGAELHGLVLSPAKPAPPLALRNYTGTPVSLAALRGKAVLVTFVYTHCTDVCPLIVANLAAAQRQLGPAARKLRILAVTVDPRRDTPKAIKAFLSARNALGRMDYLLGSQPQLARTWKAWDVAITVDTKHVTTGHTGIIYGITASGRVAEVYPANFDPAEVVHDVPILART